MSGGRAVVSPAERSAALGPSKSCVNSSSGLVASATRCATGCAAELGDEVHALLAGRFDVGDLILAQRRVAAFERNVARLGVGRMLHPASVTVPTASSTSANRRRAAGRSMGRVPARIGRSRPGPSVAGAPSRLVARAVGVVVGIVVIDVVERLRRQLDDEAGTGLTVGAVLHPTRPWCSRTCSSTSARPRPAPSLPAPPGAHAAGEAPKINARSSGSTPGP